MNRSTLRLVLTMVLAPAVGLVAFVSRTVSAWPSAFGPSSILEVFAHAFEDTSSTEIVRLVGAGVLLGVLVAGIKVQFGSIPLPAPVVVGYCGVALFPFLTIIDVFAEISDSSHQLLPIEFVFHAAYGALMVLGALLPYAVHAVVRGLLPVAPNGT